MGRTVRTNGIIYRSIGDSVKKIGGLRAARGVALVCGLPHNESLHPDGRGSPLASQVTQMALDELHARRLATVVSVAEDALARIELTLDRSGHGGGRLAPARVQALRQKIASMRRVLERAVERFGIRPVRPEPRQVLTGVAFDRVLAAGPSSSQRKDG